MFTFTIKNGQVLNVTGVPDLIFKSNEYNQFLQNLSVFEENFPGKIFGCVEDTDTMYDLTDDRKVPIKDNDDMKVGVYFGICK